MFNVTYRLQIALRTILPAILELLGDTAAALAEAGIADLAIGREDLSTGLADSLLDVAARCHRNALIALAMVVGTDIKDGVVLTVVPANELVVLLDKREEAVVALAHLTAFLHLSQKPTTGDNGMSLKEFHR